MGEASVADMKLCSEWLGLVGRTIFAGLDGEDCCCGGGGSGGLGGGVGGLGGCGCSASAFAVAAITSMSAAASDGRRRCSDASTAAAAILASGGGGVGVGVGSFSGVEALPLVGRPLVEPLPEGVFALVVDTCALPPFPAFLYDFDDLEDAGFEEAGGWMIATAVLSLRSGPVAS